MQLIGNFTFGATLLIVAIILAQQHTAQAIDFIDCEHNNIYEVDVEGCKRGAPCTLPRGKPLGFRALFRPMKNYAEAITNLRVRVGFIEQTVSGAIDANACERYIKCPLLANRLVWVNTTFEVPSSAPKFKNVGVTLRLLSPRDNRVILCGRVKINLR